MSRTIEDEDRTGLTLARLAELVDFCREHGVPMDTVPRVRATLAGRLRTIAIDLDTAPARHRARATADDVR